MRIALATVTLLLISTSALATNVATGAAAPGVDREGGASFVGLSGLRYSSDFGVAEGHCNRAALDSVLIAAANRDGRDGVNVATFAGSDVGAWIRWKIGREIQPGDRVCIGQALELAAPEQSVVWDEDGVAFELVPGNEQRSAAGLCRDFVLSAVNQGHRALRHSTACQWRPGVWELADY